MVQEKPRADTNYQSSLRILLSLPSTEYRSRVPQLQALAAITDGINSCTNSTESRSAPNPGLWHLSRNSRCSPATARDARRGGSHLNSRLRAASMYPLFDYLARSCVITPGAAREGGQNLPRTDLSDRRHYRFTKGYPCQAANQLKSAIHVPARLTRRDGSKCRRAGAAQSPQFG